MTTSFHIEPGEHGLLSSAGLDTLYAWLRLRDPASAQAPAFKPRFFSPHRERVTLSIEVPDENRPGQSVRLFAKVHFAISPFKSLENVLFTGRVGCGPIDEFRWLKRLGGLGIDAMAPVATGRRSLLGLPLAAVLVVRAVPPPQDLFKMLVNLRKDPASPLDPGLWSAIGRTVGSLRRHSIWWDDLKAKHLFPQPPASPDGPWRVYLIDVERMTSRAIGQPAAEKLLWSTLLSTLPYRPQAAAIDAMATAASTACPAAAVSPAGLAELADAIFSRRPTSPPGDWRFARAATVRGNGLAVNVNYRDALESAGLADLNAIMAFESGQSLTKPGLPATRRRDRVVLPDGRTVYLKRYRPTWRQRLARAIRPGRGSSEARDEWQAIYRLAANNVPVPEPVLLGESGSRRAAEQSCVAIAELADAESLERWLPRHGPTLKPEQRRELIDRLADFVAHFHSLGMAHRDLYLSHIFIRWQPVGQQGQSNSPGPIFWLIDLARVFKPAKFRRRRWVVKDLASLRYSLGGMIERNEWDEFLVRYVGGDRLFGLSRQVARKVAAISRHATRRSARLG